MKNSHLSWQEKQGDCCYLSWHGLWVYLVYDCLVAIIKHESPSAILAGFNPLYGTSIHLWYLPFAFLGLLAVYLLRKTLGNEPINPMYLATLLILAIVSAVSGTYLTDLAMGTLPLPQYIFSLPALFIGIALGFGQTQENKHNMTARVLALPAVIVAIIYKYEMTGNIHDYLRPCRNLDGAGDFTAGWRRSPDRAACGL